MIRTSALLSLVLLAACSTAPTSCPDVSAQPTASVWDNGQDTFFNFPGHERLPSVFAINPDGKEAVVPYTVEGHTIVAHQLARDWRVRDGDAIACVTNNNFDAVGSDFATDTVSPNIRRVPNTGRRPQR